MEPLRVLHIVTHMNRGGLETMLMNCYRALDREAVQFDFLTHREGKKDYDDEILSMGGRIYHLPRLDPFSLPYRAAASRFFRSHTEYHTVHAHLDCMSAPVLGIAAANGVAQRIAHSHSTFAERTYALPVKLCFRKMIPRAATRLLACSAGAGRFMFGNSPFEVIPNGIDTERFDFSISLRERVRAAEGLEHKFVIGHVGGFRPVKNHRFIIELFARIAEKRKDAHLLLVGDTFGRTDIGETVKARGLEKRVTFAGVRTDVAALMCAMDVFVLPSLFEGLPVSLIEAQTNGLPCVVSEGVTEECRVTELVTRLPLDVSLWADKVIAASFVPRRGHGREVLTAGYDVSVCAQRLCDIYLGTESKKMLSKV